MGCDIHFHSEVKRKGVWQHHSEIKIERNYPLFAKMANVRNYGGIAITPISQPKGLPEDATELTRLDAAIYAGDGHSHSWLNAKEIKELHDWIRDKSHPDGWFGGCESMLFEHRNFPYLIGSQFDTFTEFPKDWEEYEVEDVRYVFFFDN